MGKFQDLTGQKIGHLTIQHKEDSDSNRSIRWSCLCDCGNPKPVLRTTKYLNQKQEEASCGCVGRQKLIEFNKHTKKQYNTYNLDGEYGIGYTNKGEEFYFDLEDYDKIKNYCWRIHNRGYVSCSVNMGKDNPKKDIMMHRVVMDCNDSAFEIDHINGIKTRNDNRKYNLRICTHQENLCNYPIPKNNTSGIIGVSYNERNLTWMAYITYQDVKVKLGEFQKKENAIIARLQAEQKYFGEFAPQKHLYDQYDLTKKVYGKRDSLKYERLGMERYNNQGCTMKLIEYNTCHDIIVEFQDEHRYKKRTEYAAFLDGRVTNPYCNIKSDKSLNKSKLEDEKKG